MERPLDNYQLVMFHYVGDERREQAVSVRDLAHAMRAILGYDSESGSLVRSVDWETEAELNLAGLVHYRDALQRIVDELGVPQPESSGDLSAADVECNGPRDCIGTERGCYHCDPEKFVAQGNASYVLDWLRQTEAPSNIIRLQETAIEQLGGYLGAVARQVLR